MNKLVKLKDIAIEFGASKCGIIEVADIEFDSQLRMACEANYCGNFGKNWTCPPHIGEINKLIASAKEFNNAIVYQLIGKLEDSYDFEGMKSAGQDHDKLSRKLLAYCKENHSNYMLLSAGGCKYCDNCHLKENKPCVSPDNALASLEAYGINVTTLARSSGMKYINGQNTVTYFGAVFL